MNALHLSAKIRKLTRQPGPRGSVERSGTVPVEAKKDEVGGEAESAGRKDGTD